MGQQVNVYKSLNLKPGAIVTGSWNGSFDTGGRTYYVNNITGSTTADGLSWNSAVDQVSAAITLSEAYRAIPATNNEYIRNTIVVQGTGPHATTAGGYDALTDLGEHYNLIGLGDPGGRGYGEGLPRIGADSGETTGGMENITGDYNGVYVANIQFQSGDTSPCFVVRKIRRSVFEDCAFFLAPVITGTPAAYFKLVTGANALTLRRCYTGGTAAQTDRASYGVDLLTATFFAYCMVEDCTIGGINGWDVTSTMVAGQGSVVRNNMFGNIGQGVMVNGITDQSLRTEATAGLITYINNTIQATHPHRILNDWRRFINNRAVLTDQTAAVVLYSQNVV